MEIQLYNLCYKTRLEKNFNFLTSKPFDDEDNDDSIYYRRTRIICEHIYMTIGAFENDDEELEEYCARIKYVNTINSVNIDTCLFASDDYNTMEQLIQNRDIIIADIIRKFNGKKTIMLCELCFNISKGRYCSECELSFCEHEDVCSICHDTEATYNNWVISQCKHVFHKGCMKVWMRENETCPLCRTKLDKPFEQL